MITGRQVREARQLLGWSPQKLAEASKLLVSTVMRAESRDDEPVITFAQVDAIQGALEKAGVTFNGGACSLRTAGR